MPHAGHRYGGAVPDCLRHHEARHGIRLRADKLTVKLRKLAQSDDAVASYLRRRVSEGARFDAFLASRGWYYGRPCPRCHSTRRRTYDAACLECCLRRRPLQLRPDNSVASWPQAQRSRDGWLAVKDAERRDRAGEHQAETFGPFTATSYPTGRLRVEAPDISWRADDLRTLDFSNINNLATRHPELLDLLRWAGWGT
jgi:hypothetical protein